MAGNPQIRAVLNDSPARVCRAIPSGAITQWPRVILSRQAVRVHSLHACRLVSLVYPGDRIALSCQAVGATFGGQFRSLTLSRFGCSLRLALLPYFGCSGRRWILSLLGWRRQG